jgi:hypothetical protein
LTTQAILAYDYVYACGGLPRLPPSNQSEDGDLQNAQNRAIVAAALPLRIIPRTRIVTGSNPVAASGTLVTTLDLFSPQKGRQTKH